jgi:hypothetical protein
MLWLRNDYSMSLVYYPVFLVFSWRDIPAGRMGLSLLYQCTHSAVAAGHLTDVLPRTLPVDKLLL